MKNPVFEAAAEILKTVHDVPRYGYYLFFFEKATDKPDELECLLYEQAACSPQMAEALLTAIFRNPNYADAAVTAIEKHAAHMRETLMLASTPAEGRA